MPRNRTSNTTIYLIKITLLVLASVLSGRLGLSFGFEQGSVSLVWPQTGIVFAIVMIYGRELWIGIFIGALLTNLISSDLTLALSGAVTVTISTLLAVTLLQRIGFRPTLRRMRDVLALVSIAVILGPLINATVGAFGLYLEGVLTPGSELRVWLAWWLGDSLGVLIIAPVILVWSEFPYHLPPRREIYELAATFALFLVIAWLVFTRSLIGIGFSSLAYVIFPFFIWTAVRYSQRAVATLTLFVAIVALAGVMIQLDGASRTIVWDNLLSLWSYLFTLSITALLLCAALSERREIERMVGGLEERFSKAFHSASIAISIVTFEEGRFVDVNKAYCAVSGYSRDELIGHTITELGIRSEALARPQLLEILRRDEPIVEVEQRLRTKSGDIRSGLLTLEPIRLSGTLHLLGMFQDITDRLKAEAALRESEERYRQLFEGIDDTVLVHDSEGKILDVNEAACRHLGYSRDELLHMNVSKINTPEFSAGFEERMRQRREQGRLNQVEGEVLSKDGQTITVDINSKLITYQGRTAVLSVDRDITQRKLTEQKLRDSEARYRAVVEDQTEFIARIAPDWQIKFANEAFCRYYGKTYEELIDSYFKPHVHDEDFQLVRNALKSLGANCQIVTYEHRVILPDGEVRWQQWTNRAFMNDDDSIREYQFVGKDITELKRAENERLIATLEHEKMQILTDFIAAASHDFRTPLSVINTSAYLLNRVSDVEQRERHFQTIQTQIHNIERLVDGLLMMSRLDRGDVFRPAPLDLNSLIRELEAHKRAQIGHTEIALALDLAPDLPRIVGDEEWLYRSIFRLVENAVQFTPEGGTVTITTRVAADRVIVEVRDTGFGIEPKDLPYIFDRLYRGDNHRPTGGQGLGLSIAKKIIEGHNGSIEVETTPGVGSVFRVLLPLIPADSSAETSLIPKSSSPQSPLE